MDKRKAAQQFIGCLPTFGVSPRKLLEEERHGKITLSQLRQAFKTINLERRGSDEEYAEVTTREWEELRWIREKAIKK